MIASTLSSILLDIAHLFFTPSILLSLGGKHTLQVSSSVCASQAWPSPDTVLLDVLLLQTFSSPSLLNIYHLPRSGLMEFWFTVLLNSDSSLEIFQLSTTQCRET